MGKLFPAATIGRFVHVSFCMLGFLALDWPLRALALEFSTISMGGDGFTICKVNPSKDHLVLFLRDGEGQPLKSFDAINSLISASGEKLVFAMNAGMFQADRLPVGLFGSNGKQTAPINLANGAGNFFLKPNGVFLLTASGAKILSSQKYLDTRPKPLLATQSGPMLVSSGKINGAFNPKSTSRLFRNGVGVASPHAVVFAITDTPVNFYDFARLFRDALHCSNALFLDGTVSSLYAPALGRDDRKIDLGPMIGVVR